MNCLFCKIIHGIIPSTLVYADEEIIAFHDLQPQAPKHMLIIPREHIATINDTEEKHQILLGKMIWRAKKLAQSEHFSDAGYRLVFNINLHGDQTVYHIHLHLLGGRQMTWPPG